MKSRGASRGYCSWFARCPERLYHSNHVALLSSELVSLKQVPFGNEGSSAKSGEEFEP